MPASSSSHPAADRSRSLRTVLVLLGILLVVGGVIAALVGVAEEILDAVDDGDGIALWDRPVLDWAVSLRTPTLVSIVLRFTNSGGPLWQPILAGGLALFLWWRWRDPTPALLVVIVELGALAISLVGKTAVGRLRPPQVDAVAPFETSASFPSGHTLQAFAAATIIAYLLIRRYWGDDARWLRWGIGIVAFCYAVAMGFSRIFLGYHWLTDVLAAAALGLAWAGAVIVCHRLWLTRGDWRTLWTDFRAGRLSGRPTR